MIVPVGLKGETNPFKTDIISLLSRGFTDHYGRPEHLPATSADQRVYAGFNNDDGREELFACMTHADMLQAWNMAQEKGRVVNWYVGCIPIYHGSLVNLVS